jgi:predicted RNA-binding Zn ribbon-like protein
MPDDAKDFVWVGNHPGLDLVNTEAVDLRGDRRELVTDLVDLVDWAVAAGLVDAESAERCRRADERTGLTVLAWFRRLRRALRTVLESPDGAAAANALDAAVAAIPVRLSYRPGRDHSVPPLDAAEPLDRLRLALAAAALDATRLDRSRIRRCESERCALVYFDTTKNRSRRWCDMAVCGNRAKARAHYRRSRASSA